ncbi:MAG: hypothetical protein LBF36_03015 [Mycoplasmataceae bacterium]|jgi:hypothetical protein|nr:hypothetical protein [Mycoplasmataceae bacterium]
MKKQSLTPQQTLFLQNTAKIFIKNIKKSKTVQKNKSNFKFVSKYIAEKWIHFLDRRIQSSKKMIAYYEQNKLIFKPYTDKIYSAMFDCLTAQAVE